MNLAGQMKPRWGGAHLLMLAAAAVLSAAAPNKANPVFDWTDLMIDAIRVDNSGPTLSTRNLAILHIAIFDAVNSVSPAFQPYAFQVTPPTGASSEAAAVGAAHEITSYLYPGISARADQMLATFMAGQSNHPSLTLSLQFGRQIAQSMLAQRQDDGSSTDVPYIPSSDPGMWRRTPPFFRPPIAPQWRYVDFFGLFDMENFLPGPPPVLSSAEYAHAYNEVKLIGAKNSAARTSDQSQIAHFWSDFSYTSMPPGHWHLIALSIARARSDSLLENARLFALLSISQADAAIVSWEAKYRYNLWRPVTAIQRGNEDGNNLTEVDAAWESLLAAPPFPSYTSGHSTFSAASAAVLRSYFQTDDISFSATADGLPDVTRSFTNLTQCVDEIGMSRIYAGIHFSFDNVEGKKSGKKIGDFISSNYLLPLSVLPLVVSDGSSVRVHAALDAQVITEASNDLIDWHPIATNLATIGGVKISEPGTANARFYRARLE